MTATTEPATPTTSPVVDRLFALITHLTKSEVADIAEQIANLHPTNHGLEIQTTSGTRGAVLAVGATLTNPVVGAQFYPPENDSRYHPAGWYELSVTGTLADMPVRLWTAVDAAEGDTAASVISAARTDLDVLVGDAPVEA